MNLKKRLLFAAGVSLVVGGIAIVFTKAIKPFFMKEEEFEDDLEDEEDQSFSINAEKDELTEDEIKEMDDVVAQMQEVKEPSTPSDFVKVEPNPRKAHNILSDADDDM